MTACPTPELLARSLRDDADVPGDFDAHLRACDTCRLALDTLSDDDELRSWRPATAPAPSTPYAFLGPPKRPGDLGTLGPNRIEALLGKGGMGLVFRAFDESLARPVAVKVLRPEHDVPETRDRFVREARAAAAVAHENVVAVYGVTNPPDGVPYFTMAFVAGESLAERIGGMPMPPREAATILAAAADGIHAAHRQGLVHRDVKPANVLVHRTSGHVTVVDFGLARDVAGATDAGLTQAGSVVGTPHYLSPEQATGDRPVDARSDVYGLGATLFEALTGTTPYRGTPLSVLRQVLDHDPPTPRGLNDRVPPDLDTICTKAMAREPYRRYDSAVALAADLRRYLAGEPILARPAGTVEVAWRWAVRHPLPVAFAATVVVGLVASTLGWQRAAANATLADHRAVLAAEKSRLAESRARLALSSVATLADRARRIPGTDASSLAIKRDLAAAALADLAKLAAVVREAPDPDLGTVEALLTLGDTHFALGAVAEAEGDWAAARAHAESLADAHPTDGRYRRALATATTHLGKLAQQRGDAPAARERYAAAIAALEVALALNPTDAAATRELAVALNARGEVDLIFDDAVKATEDFERARGLVAGLRAAAPDDVVLLADERYTNAKLALALANRFRFPEAIAAADAADAAAARALTLAPDRPSLARDARVAKLDRAHLLCRAADWPKAEAAVRAVLTACEAAANENPDDAVLRRDVGVGHNLLACALNGLGRHVEALAAVERSFALRGKLQPGELGEVCWLGSDTAARCGKFEDAAAWCDRGKAAVDDLEKRNPVTPAQRADRDQFALYAAVYRAVSEINDDSVRQRSYPDNVFVKARAMIALQKARDGPANAARVAVTSLRRDAATDLEVRLILSGTNAILASKAAAADRDEFIRTANDDLAFVVAAYPAVLQRLHLYPEFDVLRPSPAFAALVKSALK